MVSHPDASLEPIQREEAAPETSTPNLERARLLFLIKKLQQLSPFKGTDFQGAKDILARGEYRKILYGDHLYNAGKELDTVSIVINGRIQLVQKSSTGNGNGAQVILDILEQGSLLGNMNCAGPSIQVDHDAVAVADSSVITFSRDDFWALIEKLQFTSRVHKALGEQVRCTQERIDNFILNGSNGRVFEKLRALQAQTGCRAFRVTQQELANSVGVSRITVCCALEDLESAGKIRRSSNSNILLVKAQEDAAE